MERTLKYRRIKLHEENEHYVVYTEELGELHVEVERECGLTLEEVVRSHLKEPSLKLVPIENTKVD